MAIHVAAVVLHVRGGYPDGTDTDKPLHAMAEKYRWHVVVLLNDLGVAWIEGLDEGAHMSGRDYRAIFSARKRHGARRVEYRHNGVEKFRDLM